ncbi:hypothetical protein HanXRQr2_Chr09g0369641 [Helianthus annuus]|uniref:Uncharacterized protein n=1 Tax=Helianthus annuus TaxID=4232 RepID=A0A251TRX8_HELAN|nr:hypothetical protein HanXRQr2_Chr09g0369641 [Helianthus annuus]KAJ0891615.1 hypothetical protein HanPSC8_Chr09g0356091 [Helianthus annuus]
MIRERHRTRFRWREKDLQIERVPSYLLLVPPLTSIGHPSEPPPTTRRRTLLVILHLQKRHR